MSMKTFFMEIIPLWEIYLRKFARILEQDLMASASIFQYGFSISLFTPLERGSSCHGSVTYQGRVLCSIRLQKPVEDESDTTL